MIHNRSGGRGPEFPPDMFLNSGGDQDNLGFIKNALMTVSMNSAIKSLSSHSSRDEFACRRRAIGQFLTPVHDRSIARRQNGFDR